jgi:hypothetical protein
MNLNPEGQIIKINQNEIVQNLVTPESALSELKKKLNPKYLIEEKSAYGSLGLSFSHPQLKIGMAATTSETCKLFAVLNENEKEAFQQSRPRSELPRMVQELKNWLQMNSDEILQLEGVFNEQF